MKRLLSASVLLAALCLAATRCALEPGRHAAVRLSGARLSGVPCYVVTLSADGLAPTYPEGSLAVSPSCLRLGLVSEAVGADRIATAGVTLAAPAAREGFVRVLGLVPASGASGAACPSGDVAALLAGSPAPALYELASAPVSLLRDARVTLRSTLQSFAGAPDLVADCLRLAPPTHGTTTTTTSTLRLFVSHSASTVLVSFVAGTDGKLALDTTTTLGSSSGGSLALNGDRTRLFYAVGGSPSGIQQFTLDATGKPGAHVEITQPDNPLIQAVAATATYDFVYGNVAAGEIWAYPAKAGVSAPPGGNPVLAATPPYKLLGAHPSLPAFYASYVDAVGTLRVTLYTVLSNGTITAGSIGKATVGSAVPLSQMGAEKGGHAIYVTTGSGYLYTFPLSGTIVSDSISSGLYPGTVQSLRFAQDATRSSLYVTGPIANTVWRYALDGSGNPAGSATSSYSVPGGPTAIAVDPTSSFVYVATGSGKIYQFAITDSSGSLSPLSPASVDAGGSTPFDMLVMPVVAARAASSPGVSSKEGI